MKIQLYYDLLVANMKSDLLLSSDGEPASILSDSNQDLLLYQDETMIDTIIE